MLVEHHEAGHRCVSSQVEPGGVHGDGNCPWLAHGADDAIANHDGEVGAGRGAGSIDHANVVENESFSRGLEVRREGILVADRAIDQCETQCCLRRADPD